MAEEAVGKLHEELNCSIRLDRYTDPRILQCFHVYCLVALVKLDQQGQLSLSCPICRQVTPIPASGTAGLQSAFRINRLLEIVEEKEKANDSLATVKLQAPHWAVLSIMKGNWNSSVKRVKLESAMNVPSNVASTITTTISLRWMLFAGDLEVGSCLIW